MKITFIGHASILIETRGLRILSDPWWRGPCFGAQWWTYPLPHLAPLEQPVDHIYVSHGHNDHFHPGTLRTLNQDATVLVSKNIDVAAAVRELGMKVVEIGDEESYEPSPGVRMRIVETHASDTFFAIDDGEEVCVNLNDALHSAPEDLQERFIARLKDWYPKVDYLFCGYGVASHFPNCYIIPGKDREATAAKRQAFFNRRWAKIVQGLRPRFAFPFAADVAFLEENLIWTNEPTHNTERPTDVFRALEPGSPTTALDIAPGFEVAGGAVSRSELRRPTSAARLRAECAEGVRRANAYGTATDDAFAEVLELFRSNVERCTAYLREHAGNYRFLVRFRNHPFGIAISKDGAHISVTEHRTPSDEGFDIVYRTRLHYLKASLTMPYGDEILFVGSGGMFEYRDAASARMNLHRELMTMLLPHKSAPRSRFGDSSPAVYRLKRAVKSALGRQPTDLYDLGAWTVWQGETTRP